MIEDIRDGRRALASLSRVGLGDQAAMYLQCAAWKAEALQDDDDVKGYVDPSRIKKRKLIRYNAEDCVRTAQIRTHHLREFREDSSDKDRLANLYSQQKRLAQVGAEMSIKGFPVDEARRKRLAKILTDIGHQQAAILSKQTRKYGNIRVNVGRVAEDDMEKEGGGGVNNNDLKALIFRECKKPGIKCFNLEVPFANVSRTDSNAPSVKKQALLYLFGLDNTPQELKEIIRTTWKVNAPLKVRNTFIDSDLVISRIGPDRRMHASINTCGAETGRWSCSKPNLFNLSEDKDEAESVRGTIPSAREIYVAPNGHVIVHRDWKQLELWVIGDYTGDLTMLELLRSADAHSERAYRLFAGRLDRSQPVPKAIRRISKEAGFLCNYAGGVEILWLKILEVVDSPVYEEVYAIHQQYPELHPGIKAHWERSLAFAETHGFNETAIMGRRRYYPPGVHLKPTETSNYAIQGTAADIANCTMVGMTEESKHQGLYYKLKKYFPDAWLAMHTYDSFDVICKERDARAVDELMNECMRGPWKVGSEPRFYESDGKVSDRWSEV